MTETKDTFEMKMHCHNCGFEWLQDFPKGTRFVYTWQGRCPYCGVCDSSPIHSPTGWPEESEIKTFTGTNRWCEKDKKDVDLRDCLDCRYFDVPGADLPSMCQYQEMRDGAISEK